MRMRRLGWFAPVMLGLVAGFPGSSRVEAQAPAPYVWKSVKVGAGGFIPGIVFSRVERGLAFLRSDMGGAYRWDDGQKTWLPLHDQFSKSSYFGTESIAPDPINPNVVYIAAGMYRNDPAAILRSRDKGKPGRLFLFPFAWAATRTGAVWASGWQLTLTTTAFCTSAHVMMDSCAAPILERHGRKWRVFRFPAVASRKAARPTAASASSSSTRRPARAARPPRRFSSAPPIPARRICFAATTRVRRGSRSQANQRPSFFRPKRNWTAEACSTSRMATASAPTA